MRYIKRHIIHCSDSAFGDVKEIRKWHKARGFLDVGYHFIIRTDGEIEMGRPMHEIGAHCKGYNTSSIGTCLIGSTHFTSAQFTALKVIHKMLRKLFPQISLNTHNEFYKHKVCPNFNLKERVGL
ncbi:MAG: N-acetylmuramoyl-L-alanine amidase [Alphaproteobacteria bacterium]|jgi:N-acetylmuramoyl-L-alanine amidase